MGFFTMLLVIEFAPLIVGSGDLILLTSPELCMNLWKNKCDCLRACGPHDELVMVERQQEHLNVFIRLSWV